jgi:YD repeat-containing protein
MPAMAVTLYAGAVHADDCFYCGTNKKYYNELGVCARECKVSIAHFTDICMPTANQCSVPTTPAGDPTSDPKNQGPCDCDCVGDPISLGCGNKFEEVQDYTTFGSNRLSFSRYYNSVGSASAPITSLGGHWRSTFDRYLRMTAAGSEITAVVVEQATGRALTFTKRGEQWVSDSDVDVRLARAGDTWTLVGADDTVETYAAKGNERAFLTAIRARNGYRQSLQYDAASHLVAVVDSYGRQLTFTY